MSAGRNSLASGVRGPDARADDDLGLPTLVSAAGLASGYLLYVRPRHAPGRPVERLN